MSYFKKYFLICFLFLFLGLFGGISFLNVFTLEEKTTTSQEKAKSIFDKDRIEKAKFADFNNKFSENFASKLFFVEKYGKIQKMLGKKIVDDALPERRVYKGSDNMLYYIIPDKNINKQAVENIKKLKDDTKLPFVFIMPPNKHSLASPNFPYGLLDYSTTNSNELYKKLMEIGVNTINLNSDYFKEKMKDEDSFYMTDTHWRNETAFWGYRKTLDMFDKMTYKYNNKNESDNINNYTIEKFENIYIGSMGKRVGVDYIDKKDDYSLIIPAFDTNYSYKKYDENYKLLSEKSGDFEKVFVNREILNNKDVYKDKYTTMMGYGTAYETITNNNIDDKTKIVIIKDSFAMPYSAYLSNNIRELHLFDTRYANVREALREKINAIKPDMVMFVCSPSSIYYFKDMFSF